MKEHDECLIGAYTIYTLNHASWYGKQRGQLAGEGGKAQRGSSVTSAATPVTHSNTTLPVVIVMCRCLEQSREIQYT
ncbi:hypothetical protein E2C01_075793 [Portunus trituberculatus]|uniref:Uncharacterized protein n=1 Tax=Portunus trituberculatus TaxID=210409 RepID=A0A5B7II03_PORTR|nr:hypothetical protein [Portunus trituberculatus]